MNRKVGIIGSGLSAYGACCALLSASELEIEIIDIGLRGPRAGVTEAPVANAVARQGSFFPYGVNDRRWSQTLRSQRLCSSHAYGGYANVYSGSMLVPQPEDLTGWPPGSRPAAEHYREVLRHIQVLGEEDELSQVFSIASAESTPESGHHPERSSHCLAGRSRVGLNRSRPFRDDGTCRIFTPCDILDAWTRQGRIRQHQGCFVERLRRGDDGIEVLAETEEGRSRFVYDVVFVGAGCINTTGIIDRSLHSEGMRTYPLAIAPILLMAHYRRAEHPPSSFSLRSSSGLAEFFVELKQEATAGTWCHTQIGPLNKTILRSIHALLPGRLGRFLMAWLKRHIYYSLSVFHSSLGPAGTLSSSLQQNGTGRIEHVLTVGEPPQASPLHWRRAISAAIHRHRRLMGLVCLPLGNVLADWLRGNRLAGWHYGGSLPMQEEEPSAGGQGRSCSADGELHGLPGVFLIDASGFPSIPGSTVALLTMANACRIASRWSAGLACPR